MEKDTYTPPVIRNFDYRVRFAREAKNLIHGSGGGEGRGQAPYAKDIRSGEREQDKEDEKRIPIGDPIVTEHVSKY